MHNQKQIKTIRDEIAIAAMQGIIAGCGNYKGIVNYNDTVLAMNAYKLADAMLMARDIDIAKVMADAQKTQQENAE